MKDLPCQKRRRVVIRNRDGSQEEVYRCANGIVSTYKSDVDRPACAGCPLRRPLLQLSPSCKEHPPAEPTWPQPYFGEHDNLIYPYQEDVEQPPVPAGYTRKGEAGADSWWFINEWGKCAYREMVNRRTPSGDIQINAYCIIKAAKRVSCDDCKLCLDDLSKVGGELDKKTVEDNIPIPEPMKEELGEDAIPQFPGAGEMLNNYWKAVKKWIAAGRPTRGNTEMKKIHEEFCSKCDWYDADSQRCKNCGCTVKPKGIALLNKIKMQTEHCPRSFW